MQQGRSYQRGRNDKAHTMRRVHMCHTIYLLICLLGVTAYTAFGTTSTTQVNFLFDDRNVLVVLPKNFHSHRLYPLIVNIHGFGVNGAIEIGYQGYDKLPGKHDVIVAAPTGSVHPNLGVTFWNATLACCGFEYFFGPTGVDDVDYLTRLIDELSSRYPIDPERIYLVGHSNGGFMAHRMACDRAERLAAIVALSGTTHFDPDECHPSAPVNILHIHGTADTRVSFDGGTMSPSGNPGGRYPGAIETVGRWADLNGCSGPRTDLGRHFDISSVIEGKETRVSRYRGCPTHAGDVELWTIVGADHVTPLTEGDHDIPEFAKRTWEWLKIRRKR